MIKESYYLDIMEKRSGLDLSTLIGLGLGGVLGYYTTGNAPGAILGGSIGGLAGMGANELFYRDPIPGWGRGYIPYKSPKTRNLEQKTISQSDMA